jgi:hypothetical protein
MPASSYVGYSAVPYLIPTVATNVGNETNKCSVSTVSTNNLKME